MKTSTDFVVAGGVGWGDEGIGGGDGGAGGAGGVGCGDGGGDGAGPKPPAVQPLLDRLPLLLSLNQHILSLANVKNLQPLNLEHWSQQSPKSLAGA